MQGSKLYVGNLSYSVTSEDLSTLFANHGQVESVNVIEGKGFAFVEMGNQAEAETAKEKLDGTEFKGRAMRVSEAKPRDNSRKKTYGRRY